MRGAFFLLLGGRESQVFVLPLACSLSSHHSVTPDPESGLGCGPSQDPHPHMSQVCPSPSTRTVA